MTHRQYLEAVGAAVTDAINFVACAALRLPTATGSRPANLSARTTFVITRLERFKGIDAG